MLSGPGLAWLQTSSVPVSVPEPPLLAEPVPLEPAVEVLPLSDMPVDSVVAVPPLLLPVVVAPPGPVVESLPLPPGPFAPPESPHPSASPSPTIAIDRPTMPRG